MPSHRDFARGFREGLAGGPAPQNATAQDPAEIERRFDVYRNNVAHGLTQALARHFPAIERLLGEDCFRGLARAYIAEHPPRTPILTDWGGAFPAYLADEPSLQSMSYLPDVARIEWARSRAYHAADSEPIAPERLQETATRAGTHLCLDLHPSVQVLQLLTPAGSIWASQQPGGPAPPRAKEWRPETLLIARRGISHVITSVVRSSTGRFVSALCAGETVARAQDRAGADFDLNAALLLLVENALIVGAGIETGDES